MQMFGEFEFFVYLISLMIPALFLGLREMPIRRYGMLISPVFIWLAVGSNVRELCYMAGFCVYEFILTSLYLKRRSAKGRRAPDYYVALALSILPLAAYKVLAALGNPHHILGFLGISYMTFKVAQIVIETYDGLISEIRADNFLYLLIFFPTVTSGPIDRSRRFEEDIHKVIPKQEYLELVGEGLLKILKGLVYKMVLAAGFYAILNYFGSDRGLKSILIYMYAYGLYLFFDFAGYSLMAVGTAHIFGVKTPDNFRAPFISKDIKEFWDRWHITLSHWFRDYLFSRITMNIVRKRVIKDKLVIAGIAFMINMGVMGCWHGLETKYILYGLYHGLLLTSCEVFQKKSGFYKKYKKNRVFIVLEWFVTFNLVMFGFLIFSGRIDQYLPALLSR